MSQSRKMSMLETVTSTCIGFVIAIASQYVIFPVFGIHVPLHEHLEMGVFFTVVSVVRGYLIRRLFNSIRG